MTHTAESYILDTSVVTDEGQLDFADESLWPTDRLVGSFTHDYNQLALVGGSPERARQIGRSIMHKGFELRLRGVSLPEDCLAALVTD